MHGEDAFLWENEVHHGEDGLLDFTSVASTTNDDFFGSVVDDDKALGVQTVALGVGLEVRCVKNGEFRLVLGQLVGAGANEHVAGEGVVPGIVVDDADGQGFGKVGAAVQVLNEEGVLLGQKVDDLGSHAGEGVEVGGDVDVAPVDVVGDRRFVDDVLVVGRSAGSLTGLGHQRPVGAQKAFTALDSEVDECFGFEVPIDVPAGGDAVRIEASGRGAVGAAHAGRFRRPSLSLLARRQVATSVPGACEHDRWQKLKTNQKPGTMAA